MEKLRRCHYRVYGALDHGQRPVAIYCAMWAALDELSFGNPCGTGPRWKIISSILRGAANFDVRGNMKEEVWQASAALALAPHRLDSSEARE